MSTPTSLVQKLWNYCNILRDGGLSYEATEVERRSSVVQEFESPMSRGAYHQRQRITV
jgi:hypothetical protein